MAELADAPDLGSGGNPRAGSTPVIRTIFYKKLSTVVDSFFCCINPYKIRGCKPSRLLSYVVNIT